MRHYIQAACCYVTRFYECKSKLVGHGIPFLKFDELRLAEKYTIYLSLGIIF